MSYTAFLRVDFKAKTLHFVVTVPQQSSRTDFEWVGTIEGEPTKIKAIGFGVESIFFCTI